MAGRTRSEMMRAVKSRDTKPELLVARLVRAHGVRIRRDVATLPGRPDILAPLPRGGGCRGLAIFVHGCWWHGHDCRRGARVPRTNREYWLAKVARNRRRDRRVTRELRALGYSVWVVWECGLLGERLPARLLGRIRRVAADRE
ncbi:MAG: DNA mismatch endonuclease Vsr [Lacipirellulaceae bacterium]